MKITEIEQEFGQDFVTVLKGFAADGHNRAFTARCLGVSYGWFYHQLEKLGAVGVNISWPCRYASRDTVKRPRTPAQVRAFNEQVAPKALEGAMKYWAENRVINKEKMLHALELRRAGLTWRKIAHHIGTDMSVLYRERKRQQITDPLGNRLQKATQWGSKRHP